MEVTGREKATDEPIFLLGCNGWLYPQEISDSWFHFTSDHLLN